MTHNGGVNQTVDMAHAAFLRGRNEVPSVRAAWLEAVADGLDDHGEELVRIGVFETSLAEGRLQGELVRTAFQLRLFAREMRRGEPLDAVIDHADENWGMGPRPDLRRYNVPLGVVGVFGASNFPFAFSVIGGDSAAALAAGCSVVHKVHEAHPKLGARTAEIVTKALSEAGAPEHLFSVVTERADGEQLIDHPLTKAVAFTGSLRVGRLLEQRASMRDEPIPFYGELGSVNPVVVTPQAWQARRPEIIASFVESYTLGMGQFCTKPGLLFVPEFDEGSERAFREAISQSIASPMLTSELAHGFITTRSAMSDREGVRALVPGGEGPAPAPALFTTTVDETVTDPAIIRGEMFGPASVVVQYRDLADLQRAVERLEGQLTATIHAEADDDVTVLLESLQAKAGRVIWNAWPTGVTVSYAQQHGGPFPATTAPGTTSVGTEAVGRFMRPISFQGLPEAALPDALKESNPWGIARRVDGQRQSAVEGAL